MGALTVPEHVYQALVEASGKHGVFAHGFTYSGHPLACAVALKTIEIYERIEIVEHVRRVAPIFQLRLRALADHPLVGEARGVGLIGGLELVKDKRARQSFDAKLGVGAKAARLAEEEGVLCRAVGGDTRRALPAARHRRRRDQRHVRLHRPRARPHRKLGAQGGAPVAQGALSTCRSAQWRQRGHAPIMSVRAAAAIPRSARRSAGMTRHPFIRTASRHGVATRHQSSHVHCSLAGTVASRVRPMTGGRPGHACRAQDLVTISPADGRSVACRVARELRLCRRG